MVFLPLPLGGGCEGAKLERDFIFLKSCAAAPRQIIAISFKIRSVSFNTSLFVDRR